MEPEAKPLSGAHRVGGFRRTCAGAFAVLGGIWVGGQASAAGSLNSRAEEIVPEPSGATVSQPSDKTAATRESLLLPPLQVTASVFKYRYPPMERLKLDVYQLMQRWPVGWGWRAGTFVLTPGRAPQRSRSVAYPFSVIEGSTMASAPSQDLSYALHSASEWNDRLVGGSASSTHARRISLRGLRGSLVLLDGVPLNDPWSNTVRWNEVPREDILQVELVAGGGTVPWDAPSAGVVQFLRMQPSGRLVTESVPPVVEFGQTFELPPVQFVRGAGRLAVVAGDFGTRTAEFMVSQPTGAGVLQVLGRAHTTEGYAVVAAAQRGQVDAGTWARHQWLEVRWRQPLGQRAEVTATVRHVEETAGLGTARQQQGASGTFASLAFLGEAKTFTWSGVAYAQQRDANQNFSAVNAARTSEILVIDELARPTAGWGVSFAALRHEAANGRTTLGADLHCVQGESRSGTGFASGVFTREVVAGGQQQTAGVFIMQHQKLHPSVEAVAGARLSESRAAGGFRRETDLTSGARVIDRRFGDQTHGDFSPTAGIVWQPQARWRFRASAQRGVRRPTLGQKFRDVGERSTVWQPNPELQADHGTVLHGGIEYSQSTLQLSVTGFRHDLRQAIGTRSIAGGSGESALLESLPNGYEGRTWLNLDKATVQGVQLSVRWFPCEAITFDGGLVLQNTSIDRVLSAPQLVGKAMPWIPDRTAVVNATWRISPRLTMRARVRFDGREFVDEENTRRLGEAVIADISGTFPVSTRIEIFFAVDNIGGVRVETSKNPGGVVYVGAPRMASAGMRCTW